MTSPDASPAAAPAAHPAVVIPRTGIGTDVHAFAAPDSGTPLRLACLDWPGETGLAGHSDGDVVAHACCDALFSAAALGDLGSNFGTAEPQWKGAAVSAVQLVGERPRIAPRMAEATAALTQAVGAPVHFSATTTDHLGFLGRAEGLLAIATALVHAAEAPTRA